MARSKEYVWNSDSPLRRPDPNAKPDAKGNVPKVEVKKGEKFEPTDAEIASFGDLMLKPGESETAKDETDAERAKKK